MIKQQTKSAKRRKRRVTALAKAVEKQTKDKIYATAPTIIQQQPPENGGLGVGLENKLLGRAIAGRWPVTQENLDKALEVTLANMYAEDARASNGAVKNILAMRSQNLEHEKHEAGLDQKAHASSVAAVQVNINGVPQPASGVRIVQRDDFYQNTAHDRDAEAIEPSTAAAAVAGAV